MKKILWVLVILLIAMLPTAPAYAGGNNPNSFELDMNCSGEIVHIAIPVLTSSAGLTDDGRIGHPRTHYIDFNDGNGFQLIGFWGGRGNQTVWCTWIWDNDPFLHGMDIQFSPAK
jgi:hypothetical protein